MDPLFTVNGTLGLRSGRVEVSVFADHFLYSVYARGFPIARQVHVPLASVQKIRWDSKYKAVVDWVSAEGQFRQYILVGSEKRMDRFVNHLQSKNKSILIDATDREKSHDRELNVFILMFLLMMAVTATVVWGARFFGLLR